MKILCQFENSGRKASQLRSMIEDLKRGALLLEADTAVIEKFEREADPSKSAYPIAARAMKVRRDNLSRTISILEEELDELEGAPSKQSASVLRD